MCWTLRWHGLTSPAVAAVAGLSVEETRAVLVELAHAHLVTEHATDRFGFAFGLWRFAAIPHHAQHLSFAKGHTHQRARREWKLT